MIPKPPSYHREKLTPLSLSDMDAKPSTNTSKHDPAKDTKIHHGQVGFIPWVEVGLTPQNPLT